MKIYRTCILIWIIFLCCESLMCQSTKASPTINSGLTEELISGLKFRNIGPALMSGRISDIAIHPQKPATWYVAAGSGGVWKTENAGNTFTPIFDNYTSFSIGCVSIDPAIPSTVWVGTGENIGGRHVGFGDGIYRSDDDGKSFVNMGLKQSEHISKIIIDPSNSNVILVAAQGPLWNKGGDRGVFKSIDGGKSWKQTLGDKEWIGATDLVLDPRDSKVMYAATWQRHRTIAGYLGGGPGTAIYKTNDGGDTWVKLSNGLPTSNMGKIGLALSPQNPNVIYAAIELDRRSGGVYRSQDAGRSWQKMSDAVAGATGPHYYQELYASPHYKDRIYLMDVRVQVSNDGGKTFSRLKEENKHSDNHAIAFLPDRPDYLLMGTDGGLYESHDHAENWRFFANLPLTQFYDVAIDDSFPFYNMYGGTQDNSTQGGPSRTAKVQGIQNSDWSVVLDWDGQQPATEPGNPNIIYGQRQEGTLSRIDMTTGEITDIQPTPNASEPYERFNWDAPILVSPHNPRQLFFASQRVWRSDDRGDSWRAISQDLTRNQFRLGLPIMGSTQGYDNAWDVNAMSNFNTITMIAESPIQRDLIYVGTDDGLIQITEDGGTTWRKMEVSSLPGCPATAYVNEIKADLFDANTAYLTADNIKYGDYAPYIFKTVDKGKTWKSIKNNFPDRQPIWRLVQDHIQKELIFAATEFGIFVTLNGGQSWVKMKGDLPTISFRDLAIHKRENELVAASFGRGFFVLDDITPLRQMSEEAIKNEAQLFDIKDAYWYIPRSHLGFDGMKGDQGAGHYAAPNPPYGAIFTYYLKDDLKSKKELRIEAEKKATAAKQALSFPKWEDIAEEDNEKAPRIFITLYDASGQVINRVEGPVKKGLHRVAWDLKHRSADPISSGGGSTASFMVGPGTYYASLSKEHEGKITSLSDKKKFVVKPLYKNALVQMPEKDVVAFWREYEKVSAQSGKTSIQLDKSIAYAKSIIKAINLSNLDLSKLSEANKSMANLILLQEMINGNKAKTQIGEKNNPTISSRFFDIYRSIGGSTYGPTKTNLVSLGIIQDTLKKIDKGYVEELQKLKSLADAILKAGGPEVMWD